MTCQFYFAANTKNNSYIQISLNNPAKSLSKMKWEWWTRLQVSECSVFIECWVLMINQFLLIRLIFHGFFSFLSSTLHIGIIHTAHRNALAYPQILIFIRKIWNTEIMCSYSSTFNVGMFMYKYRPHHLNSIVQIDTCRMFNAIVMCVKSFWWRKILLDALFLSLTVSFELYTSLNDHHFILIRWLSSTHQYSDSRTNGSIIKAVKNLFFSKQNSNQS